MQNAAVERPWEQSWFYVDPDQKPIAFHLVMIHVLAVVGLFLYPLPSVPVLLLTLTLATLGGLGTTVAYHRSLSHRSVKLHPAVEQFLIFWAVFNGSGAPRQWVANHRRHHATSDTDEDISSPRHGFWWSHIRWLYQVRDSDPTKWNRDMDKPRYNFWTTVHIPMIVLSATCGAAFGWVGFFWAGPIRMVYSLHGQCLVNSLTHMGPVAKEGDDSSINVWWLGPFQLAAWGENWHRNHHSEAFSARFARAWYQIDIGWYVICGLKALGLATDVRREKSVAVLTPPASAA
jgi:stearoyl-CoA desaturase (delta-9 desaturase)